MKQLLCLLLLFCSLSVSAQSEPSPKFFAGIALGASFPLGDFGDLNVSNSDAGFAENGNRYDLYGGYLLTERVTLIAGVRYQNYGTDLSEVVDLFEGLNPAITFIGETRDWQIYYLLTGAACKVPIGTRQKYSIFPRIGLGPMWVQSPGLEVEADNGNSDNSFFRNSGTGIGLGYDIGVGLRTELGKRLVLLPTFTFSGGSASIPDVETTLNGISSTRDFTARVLSFNLGLSLAVRI